MIQYYYTKKEWGVVMEKEELKILEELRRILNSKNEAIVIRITRNNISCNDGRIYYLLSWKNHWRYI